MFRSRRPALPLLVLVGALAALVGAPGANAAGASGAVKLSVLQSPVLKLPMAQPGQEYANVDSISTDGCGAKGVPVAVGWKSTGAGVLTTGATFYAGAPVAKGYRLTLRAPLAAATMRAITLCATGPVGAKLKTKRGGGTVSCGAATALGLGMARSWAYATEALFTKPLGTNRWQADASGQTEPTAICVAKSAFTKVVSRRVAGSFAAGARTTTLTAACSGGRRALAWGFEAPTMPGNEWTNGEQRISVPYVGSAVPAATNWKLTFHTPDGKPAAGAAQLAAWVTCGVPRSA